MTKKKVSVYIGRFQPFHNGHKETLTNALKNSDLTIVLIGSAYQARTTKNPFTYQERMNLIAAFFAEVRYYGDESKRLPITSTIDFAPIADQPYNDAKWIQSVQEAVENTVDYFRKKHPVGWEDSYEVTLVGSDRDDSCWYLHAFPQWKLQLMPSVPTGSNLSATSVREYLFEDCAPANWMESCPEITRDFLAHFMQTTAYSTLREEYHFLKDYKQRHKYTGVAYDATYQTADAVVIQSGHVLVTVRGHLPGRGLWALPGGFVKSHQTKKDCAVTETIEETGIKLAEGKNTLKITKQILLGSIKAKEEFDAVGRSLRGRTFTTAFLVRLDDTKPLPKVSGQFAPLEDTGGKEGVVETLHSMWVPISVARKNTEMWFEDHHAILDWAIGQIKE